ncbi:MAG TPA: phage holin family protein [Thermomicrobiales bacterium]
MSRLIAYVIGSMVAVLAVGTLFRGRFVTYENEFAVLVFAFILGVLNAYIKPLLALITLPLTCLTFGLFALALNAALFGLAAWLTPGMSVTFWGAVIGALAVGLANGIVFSIVDETA